MTLSPKQQIMLEWIRQYIAERHYPPTLREIGAGCGIKCVSTTFHHLAQLEAAGKIHRDFNVARGLRLLEKTNV